MKMFEPKYKNKELKGGSILLSEPLMLDQNFSRTVVLICEHNENETVGLVLNRLMSAKLSEVIDGFDAVDLPIHNGGPVEQDILQFIHTIGTNVSGTVQVGDSIFWGGDIGSIRDLAKTGSLNSSNICFFVGYAGWGKHQLLDEIEEGSWLVSDINPASLLSIDPNLMWEHCVRNLGEQFRIWLNCPVDPILN